VKDIKITTYVKLRIALPMWKAFINRPIKGITGSIKEKAVTVKYFNSFVVA